MGPSDHSYRHREVSRGEKRWGVEKKRNKKEIRKRKDKASIWWKTYCSKGYYEDSRKRTGDLFVSTVTVMTIKACESRRINCSLLEDFLMPDYWNYTQWGRGSGKHVFQTLIGPHQYNVSVASVSGTVVTFGFLSFLWFYRVSTRESSQGNGKSGCFEQNAWLGFKTKLVSNNIHAHQWWQSVNLRHASRILEKLDWRTGLEDDCTPASSD